MSKMKSLSSLKIFSCLFSSLALRLIRGLADSSYTSSPTSETKAVSTNSARSSSLLEILTICLGLLAAFMFSVFLYKRWQRKKREDQYARLLKLFGQDDQLEVELGIRD